MFEQPLDHTLVVVAERQDVIQRGEAGLLTFLLHVLELLPLELVVLDGAPVVAGVVHRETGRERAVNPYDQRVHAGTASPVMEIAFDELLHLRQALHRIHHFVAGVLLVDQPVNQFSNHRMVFFADERRVAFVMLERRLLGHRRLANVIVSRDTVVVRQLGQTPHVFQIVAADIDVQETRVAVLVLLLHHVVEVGADGHHRLRQSAARHIVPCIDCEIDGRNAGIGDFVDHLRPQQTAIGGQVNPEPLLRGVIDDFVGEVWTQQRLAAH